MELSPTEINLIGYTLTIPVYAKLAFMAAALGAIVGVEREWKQKVASIRTFAIISAGSALFAALSLDVAGASTDTMPYDVTRVAAGIVTGIGFLGGGVIFKTHDGIEGITTGAIIWFVAAIGMACGFNRIDLGVWGLIVYTTIMLGAKPLYNMIDFIRIKIEKEENSA